MRRIAFTLGLSMVLLAVASPAAEAQSRDVEVFSITYSGSASCGSFNDTWTGAATIRATTYFSSAGDRVLLKQKALSREVDVNSVTGKKVIVHGAATEYTDFVNGFDWYTGQLDMGVGPGHTQFIHDTGKVVFDADANPIKIAGPHTVVLGGDKPYCQALA
jgi:hypothetical protein